MANKTTTLDCEGLPVPRITLGSKHPHKTCWVTLKYKEGDEALHARIAAELAAVEWKPEEYAPVPPLLGVEERNFISPGSDIFNMWTPAEARRKAAAAKRVAASLGIPVYRHKLTLADML